MEILKVMFSSLLIMVLTISSFSAAATIPEIEKFSNGLETIKNARNASDLEFNTYVSALKEAVDLPTDPTRDAKVMSAYVDFLKYEQTKNNLVAMMDSAIHKADILLADSHTPKEYTSILNWLKTSLQDEKDTSNNDDRSKALARSSKLLWEITFARIPLNNSPNAPGPIPGVRPPTTPKLPGKLLPPSQNNDLAQLLAQINILKKLGIIPTNAPANNFINSLTTKELKALKKKLDELDSDDDILDCFLGIFG